MSISRVGCLPRPERGLWLHRPDLDAADPDLRALRLQLDLAECVRGIRSKVDHLAVEDVADRVTVADHLLTVPLPGRCLNVLAPTETEHILPFRIAAVPVESPAI